MSASDGGSGVIFPLAGCACGAGVLWFFVTGAVWQFVPIGMAVLVGFQVAKAINRK